MDFLNLFINSMFVIVPICVGAMFIFVPSIIFVLVVISILEPHVGRQSVRATFVKSDKRTENESTTEYWHLKTEAGYTLIVENSPNLFGGKWYSRVVGLHGKVEAGHTYTFDIRGIEFLPMMIYKNVYNVSS